MYEGCLSTVPLIHNQPINVTYPVAISALQSALLTGYCSGSDLNYQSSGLEFDVFIGLAQIES